MREFIRRALMKSARMNGEQMQSLLSLVTEEYELLDSVLDSIATGILICDSFHILVQMNKAATRILPVESHDAQDRPVWDLIRDSSIADFVRSVIENEESVTSADFSIEDFQGVRFVTVSVAPLVRSKQVRGTVITLEDITEKHNEELRSRRLESLASLTNLAATVAHEIKNPLGSISIYIQLLRKSLLGCSAPVENEESCSMVTKYLGIVEEEIERLNKIVVDFLFAVRPIRLEFHPLSINELVRSLSEFFSREFESSGVVLTIHMAEDLPLIQGDERFLRQMLVNLVKNALTATPAGGTVTISTTEKDEMAEITVVDTGEGIPEHLLQKIFEPYFTTKIDGTGLGLTMAYKVVKEHGGDITVKSVQGQGTRFIITLPVMKRVQRLIEYGEKSST